MSESTSEGGRFDAALASPQFVSDPYPIYAAMRASEPVYWWAEWNGWVLTAYDDVAGVLRLEGRGSSVVGRVARFLNGAPMADSADVELLKRHFSTGISHTDPPDHTRIRAVLNKAFSVRDIERLRPRVEQLVDGLLGDVSGKASWDVIADFAYPLPAIVIAEVIGIPPDDRERFKAWSDTITDFFGSNSPTPDLIHSGSDAVGNAREYLRELAARRFAEPRDDVLSRLGEAAARGEGLSEDEMLSTVVTFLVGGHETTTALISSGLLALLLHPGELDVLRFRADLMPSAVEEFMRFESPNQRLIRVATAPMDLHGRRVQPGDPLMLLIGAANRDPSQFSDPDALHVTRAPNRHLGFALGAHFCLGANLARLEAEVAVQAVLSRFPTLALASERPSWLPNPTFRMLRSLVVTGGDYE